MKNQNKVFLFLGFFLSHVSLCAPLEISDFWGGSPGVGDLSFTQGTEVNKISFGAESGFFAAGLIFDTKDLPHPYRSEFGRRQVLQIILGKKSSAPPSNPSFFGFISVIGPHFESKSFTPWIPKKGETALPPGGFMALLGNPDKAINSQPAERLQSMLLAKAGSLKTLKATAPAPVRVSDGQKSYNFNVSQQSATLNLSLATPFHPDTASITGDLSFPIYRPSDAAAESYLLSVAAPYLTGSDILYALPTLPREIASPKASKKR